MCVCVFSGIFSETTGPTEAKCHVVPPWDRRKFIQMVQSFVVLHYCQPRGGGGGRGLLAGILP